MKQLFILCMAILIQGCVFKIEVASPKSKLERQVLGYKPLVPKDQLRKIIKRSSETKRLSLEQCQSIRKRLKSQILISLKKGSIGEAKSGHLVILDSDLSGYTTNAVELTKINDLIRDENTIRDRLAKIDNSKASRYAYSYEEDIWVETDKGWKRR